MYLFNNDDDDEIKENIKRDVCVCISGRRKKKKDLHKFIHVYLSESCTYAPFKDTHTHTQKFKYTEKHPTFPFKSQFRNEQKHLYMRMFTCVFRRIWRHTEVSQTNLHKLLMPLSL